MKNIQTFEEFLNESSNSKYNGTKDAIRIYDNWKNEKNSTANKILKSGEYSVIFAPRGEHGYGFPLFYDVILLDSMTVYEVARKVAKEGLVDEVKGRLEIHKGFSESNFSRKLQLSQAFKFKK